VQVYKLSLQFGLRFRHLISGEIAQAKVSVVLNELAVWVDSQTEWDIFDLRNVVKTIVLNELAIVGYLKGYAYDLELTRMLSQSRGIDQVFGIDIPCLAQRRQSINLSEALAKLRDKTVGPDGVFIHRCFNDLVSSMKHADDTGFYCYRAIESLRHHCAALHGLSADDKAKQWEKFREVSGSDEQTLLTIKAAADPLRHGEASGVSSDNRAKLFIMTWEVVGRYLGVTSANGI
jgi:hypothetical protein